MVNLQLSESQDVAGRATLWGKLLEYYRRSLLRRCQHQRTSAAAQTATMQPLRSPSASSSLRLSLAALRAANSSSEIMIWCSCTQEDSRAREKGHMSFVGFSAVRGSSLPTAA